MTRATHRRSAWTRTLLLPVALCAPTAALGQDGTGPKAPVDRIGAEQVGQRAAADSVTVQQVTTSAHTVPPALPSSRSTDPGPQVAPPKDRTTAAAASGSSRSDGKPVASAAIGGSDQCDAKAGGGSDIAACRNPIERRAAQYPAPQPTRLSPEQRLAIARAAGDGVSTSAEAGRLARSPDSQLLSATEQGVASIVLTTPPVVDPAQPDGDVRVDPTVFDAIIDVIGGGQPPK